MFKGKTFGTILSILIMTALATIATAALSGCDQEKPALFQKTVRIGVIYPETGPDALTGKDIRDALELAKDIVNQSFDLPIPLAKTKGLPLHGGAIIELVYRDSKSDSNLAFAAVADLAKKERVVAVTGDYRSTVTARAGQQAEMLGIPFLNALSTSPVLTRQGLKWFFRTTPDDETFVQNFFTFLSDLSIGRKTNVSRRLILVYENKLFGTSVAQAEKKLAFRTGYKIAADIPYDAESGRLDRELTQIKKGLPGIILQTSYLNDAILFMKGYRQRNINPVAVLGMDAGFISPDFLKTLGPDGEYAMSREVWAADLAAKKPLIKQINDLFKERFKRDMNGNSARALTGLIVLAEAINRSASLKADDIRKALLKTDIPGEQMIMPWDGVRFDPATGQNILGAGIIVQVQDGRYHTVWPQALAARTAVWPMPSWPERKKRP